MKQIYLSGITQYNSASILEVYIEGRMLTRAEYTINGTYSIILNTPLSEIGTKVHFIVYRSVCASNEDFAKLKGDKGDSGAIVFNTVAEMKANTELVAGDTCQTLGYYEVNDGGAGLYKIVNDNTLVDDGGSIHELENGLKATLIINDSVNVKQFGAYGDGEHDDTNAIQTALNNSHYIYIPDGTYMINGYNQGWGHLTEGGIFPQSNSKIILSENAVLKAITNSNAFYNILNLNNVDNITVFGGKIQGEKNSHTAQGGAFGYGIRISECTDITIENIEILDCWGDGIITESTDGLTGDNKNIKIVNCVIHDCRRQGISVVIGSDVVIDKCEIHNIKGTLPESGIDIESNGQQDVYNIRITNCYIHDTNHASIIFANNFTKNVTVSDCQLDGINISGGEDFKINNCQMESIRLAGNRTLVGNCIIKRIDIEGGNAMFNNCNFEYESTVDYSAIIFIGNDNSGIKVFDLVAFNNCKFITNAKYLMYAPFPLNVEQEKTLLFSGCDIDVSENSSFANRLTPEFILKDCNLNLHRKPYNLFLMGVRNINHRLILKNTKIQTPEPCNYLINNDTNNKIFILIESCEINGYELFMYVNDSTATGDVFLYDNLVNSNSISSIIHNSVIIKHEDNNIQYE